MNVEMDSEILEAFRQSNAISTQKGSAVGLLKIGSKRRRCAAEMQALKEEQQMRSEAIDRKEEKIRDLESKVREQQSTVEVTKEAENIIGELISAGKLLYRGPGNYELLNK